MADKKKETKIAKNIEKIVEDVSRLSVLELSELVEALQDKLGVTPVAMATPATGQGATPTEGAGEAPAAAGGGNLTMTGAGDNKIAVIKALREINQNWGLKEAKDMTEALPAEILKEAKPEEVKDAAEKLKAAGAVVEVK